MHHSRLPHLILSILFYVQLTSTASNELGRDTSIISDKIYYRLGYKSNGPKTVPRLTSVFSIQKLAQIEWEVFNQIVTYCRSASNSTFCGDAASYIKDYEETSLVLKNSTPQANFIQAVSGNLNAIYRMIRRLREFNRQLTFTLKSHRVSMDGHLVEKLKRVYNVYRGPNKIDMHIAMFAIAQTQFQLDMKTAAIADGIFMGRQTGIKLKAIHCIEIGLHSIATGLYPIGIEWLEHALHETKHGDNTTSELAVDDYLQSAKMKHDKDWRPENVQDMELVFYEKPLNQTRDSSERKWRKAVESSRVPGENLSEKFWSLCTDNKEHISPSKLFCWHEKTIHPFWTIGPLKAELLSTSPNQVIQFYDIIGPKQANKIRNAMTTKFIPAILSVFNAFYPRAKLAAVCKKLPEFPELYANLGKLVTRVTGFKVNATNDERRERLELFSYAPGGYNSVHPDWSPFGILSERMATFIIYLDIPEIGGRTVFPKLDVAVKPLKGSAFLWYNVKSSGEHAQKSIHGACPVILGQKLIALNWPAYHDQDHLVCDQDPKAALNYFENGRPKSRVLAAKEAHE